MGTIVKIERKKGTIYKAIVRKGIYEQKPIIQSFVKESDAKDFITKTEAKILNGESLTPTEINKKPLRDVFDEYIESGKCNKRKAGILLIVSIEIGGVTVEKLDTNTLEKYMQHKANEKLPVPKNKVKTHKNYKGGMVVVDGVEYRKKYKESTIRHYYYAIKTALMWHARKYGYAMNKKAFEENRPPPAWKEPRERRVEEGEMEKMMRAIDKMYVNKQALRDLIQFQIYSCMRIGETLKLKWAQIILNKEDPPSSYIFIPKQNTKTKNIEKATHREVAMRPELFRLLLEMSKKANEEERVFKQWKRTDALGQRFKVICKNACIEDFVIHDFRHEGISQLFENTNLGDIEISKITGHMELDTLKRYARLRPKKTGQKLWAAFAPVVENEVNLKLEYSK